MNRSRRALEIFELAITRPEHEVAAFLDEACDDDSLRADVESLLAAAKESGDFLPSGQEASAAFTLGTYGGEVASRAPPPGDAFLSPGVVLMERYTVQETVGAGGMGKVYRASDARLGRDVAIKVLSGAHAANPEMRERFEREMRAVAAFSHPHVMEIYDIGSHEGNQVAVMELIDGTVLREQIGDKLLVEQAIDVASGVAAGLAAAHKRGLMHRDIKPENIMVSPDGHAKVLDFGLARPQNPAPDQLLTQTSMTPGTVPYMSPEQAAGEALLCSTDVFSLGTVLFEMLTGTNPFSGPSLIATLRKVADASPPQIAKLRPEVPEELGALVARMLQLDPAKRPTAKEVALHLGEIKSRRSANPSVSAGRKAAKASAFPSGSALSTGDQALDWEVATSPPKTQYARCGDIHIAYQVFGDGPINLMIVPGFISNVDNCWASPHHARWLLAFSRFARVAIFDKRGTGLSDRVSNLPNMEERIEDVCTVMDAAGFETAALLGISEGGSLASVFAATYPQRSQALVLHGSFACFSSWFETDEALEQLFDYIRSNWGTGLSLPGFAPSMAEDAEFQEWWGKFERLGANPGSAIALMRMNSQIDISRVLPSIQAPTLILHRTDDVLINPEASQFLSTQIPDSRLVSSAGSDHIPWVGPSVDGEIQSVREFLQGLPDLNTRERVLGTVLVIRLERASSVDSAADVKVNAATLDRIREQVRLNRGSAMTSHRQVYVSTFDGPVRAIRCAKAIAASTVKARLCVHTGEILLGENVVQGSAVEVATNVAEQSKDGEVVVTRIVKDLVAGSGLKFTDLADYEIGGDDLQGNPESWHLYRVG